MDLYTISSDGSSHNANGAKVATQALVRDAMTVKSADTSLSKKLGLPQAG
ncbi:MAG: hypothetical protein ACR2OB_08410 [Solirubrobacteraceae bacterium]